MGNGQTGFPGAEQAEQDDQRVAHDSPRGAGLALHHLPAEEVRGQQHARQGRERGLHKPFRLRRSRGVGHGAAEW